MRDISDLLLKMKDKFGEVVSDFDNIIRMFGSFNGKKGVLLQVSELFTQVLDSHSIILFKGLNFCLYISNYP